MDRKYVMTALGYAIIGLLLGLYMASSQNHGQLVTHAHIMLLGFVVSFIYALCHKLWLNNPTSTLAVVQFYVHQAGTLVLTIGLFLHYGKFIPDETIEPILGISSIIAFVGMVLMKAMFIRSGKTA